MSLDVPDSERKLAEQAEESFEDLLSRLKLAVEHLNLLYIPFQKYKDLDPETLVKYRRVFRKYRDQIKKNFDRIFRRAFRSIALLRNFSSDTSVEEMMNSYLDSVGEVEKQVNILLGLFDNLASMDFRNNVVASIDSVRKQINQLKQLVNDRILEHIGTNILAKNWMSDVADRYQHNVEEKVPLVIQLFKERQKALR